MSNSVRIFNGQFLPVTLSQCTDVLFADMAAGKRGWLATVNVSILMMMRESSALQTFVDKAAWTVADGHPLIWASIWFGTPLPERVTGVDLVEQLCERAQAQGIGVYFVGASQAVVETMVQRLQQSYPRLSIGYCDGYFPMSGAAERADLVAASGASILLVGMGVPRQEQFIGQQWDRLGVKLAIGVGGSFDVLAGLRKRAPIWVQRIGMEWMYRLVQEPGRLWKRYLVTNTQFVLMLARAMLFPRYRSR